MIQSMTGFGKVTAELPTKKVTVEIKALNSKQLDLSTRIPSIYKDKEMQIRSRLLQNLERGKVDFAIYIEYIGKDASSQINQEAVMSYFAQLKELSDKLGINVPSSWNELQLLLRMPDVIKTDPVEAEPKDIKRTLSDIILFPGIGLEDFKDLMKESPASMFDINTLWKEYNSLQSNHDMFTIHLKAKKIVITPSNFEE